MASASWDVATAWRDLATRAVLPWWVLAAVRAAADAFEQQAHDWHARAVYEDDRSTPTSTQTARGRAHRGLPGAGERPRRQQGQQNRADQVPN